MPGGQRMLNHYAHPDDASILSAADTLTLLTE